MAWQKSLENSGLIQAYRVAILHYNFFQTSSRYIQWTNVFDWVVYVMSIIIVLDIGDYSNGLRTVSSDGQNKNISFYFNLIFVYLIFLLLSNVVQPIKSLHQYFRFFGKELSISWVQRWVWSQMESLVILHFIGVFKNF